MKHILTLWLIGFVCIWIKTDVSVKDKSSVLDGLNVLFREPKRDNRIDLAALPLYRLTSDTNTTGRLLVVSEHQLANLRVTLKDVTPAKLTTWSASAMDRPANMLIARGDVWQDVVRGMGLEPVPAKATAKESTP